MDENDTDKKEREYVKPKIIACLLEKEVANTGAIADYCGFGGNPKGNKYRYVTRQLDALVKKEIIEAIEKYRPKGSRWRTGTGYRLTQDLVLLGSIYFDEKYADIQHTFLESEWLRKIIIKTQILPGEKKNTELLRLMLQISPTFFEFCLLNCITPDTLRSWDTSVCNINWLKTRLSVTNHDNTVSQDNQFLELFRHCLFQDWVGTYPDGQVPKELRVLLSEIGGREEQECSRLLDRAMGGKAVSRPQEYADNFSEILKQYVKKGKDLRQKKGKVIR